MDRAACWGIRVDLDRHWLVFNRFVKDGKCGKEQLLYSSSVFHRAMLGLRDPCLQLRSYMAIGVKIIVKRSKTPQRQKFCGRQTLVNPVRSVRREALCFSKRNRQSSCSREPRVLQQNPLCGRLMFTRDTAR